MGCPRGAEDIIPEYENQKNDEREQTADRWAYDSLLSENHALEFLAGNPEIWELKPFAGKRKIHPAIAAEICNRYAGEGSVQLRMAPKERSIPSHFR